MIILGTADGSLHGLDPKTGEPKWSISSWGPVAFVSPINDAERADVEHQDAEAQQGGQEEMTPSAPATHGDVKGAACGSPDGPADHGAGAGACGKSEEQAAASDSLVSVHSRHRAVKEDAQAAQMLIPSYEPGGGLWTFDPQSLVLQKIPWTMSRYVDHQFDRHPFGPPLIGPAIFRPRLVTPPWAVCSIVQAAPMTEHDIIFHGKKSIKLMAIDPLTGR